MRRKPGLDLGRDIGKKFFGVLDAVLSDADALPQSLDFIEQLDDPQVQLPKFEQAIVDRDVEIAVGPG